MKDQKGFRIMAASPETFPGNMRRCFEEIRTVIDDAVSQEVTLLLLPELCLTSSSLGALFRHENILAAAEEYAVRLASCTKDKDIICCISFPMMIDQKLYSVAALASDGNILGIVPLQKNSCIGADIFSEYTGEDTSVEFTGREVPFGKGLRFSIEGHRDLFIRIGKTPQTSEADTVYLVPDALQAGVGRQDRIRNWCSRASAKNCGTVIYCSSGEGETNSSGAFTGQTVIADRGSIIAESPAFGSGISIADVGLRNGLSSESAAEDHDEESPAETDISGYAGAVQGTPEDDNNPYPFLGEENGIVRRCEEAFEIQSRSLAGRLKKTGIRKAVLGVSGGLDSTLALLVSVRAMEILGRDRTNVVAVSMPCFGTSARTKTNAQILSEALGVDFRMIDISDAVRQHLTDIGHDTETADTAYENAQARERTQVLMDLSNMENGLVVGTGDLSEEALGWCTFNGDHMSMYNVNCSVTKTLIRAIVAHYAAKSGDPAIEAVLTDIVDTPVSPELKPAVDGEIAQKTEEIIGPYDVHDYFLYHLVRNGRSPGRILGLASEAFKDVYTEEQIRSWLKVFIKRFIQNQFKRSCSPDGPSIGLVDLSNSGWSIPGDLAADFMLEQI